jgi:hypothetical protein
MKEEERKVEGTKPIVTEQLKTMVDLAELPQNKPSHHWFLELKDIFDHDSDNFKDSAWWIEGLQNSMDKIIAATVRHKAHKEVHRWAQNMRLKIWDLQQEFSQWKEKAEKGRI